MNEFFDTFGKRLSYLLDLNDISQKEIAFRLNVSEATVSKYINDKQLPGLETVIRLANCLGCSVDFLLCRTNKVELNSKICEQNVKIKLKEGEYITKEELEELIKYANEHGIDLSKFRELNNK